MSDVGYWDQLNPPLVPDARTPDGLWAKLAQTWPVRTARGLWEGLTLPGDVYSGRTAVTDESGRTNPEVINRATDLAGAVMGGSYARPAMQDAAGMGIRAYHGSPHDFERFDLSKIGTGEGAQAYGHGLYFAENEGVARSYRTLLSKLPIPDGDPAKGAAMLIGTRGEAGERLFRESYKELGPQGIDNAIARAKEALSGSGRMYEVDIHADPAKFLDWDKPLSAQPKPIQEIGQDLISSGRGGGFVADAEKYPPTGQNIYSAIATSTGNYRDLPAATEMLREAGIPGIKYLDQGSRTPRLLLDEQPMPKGHAYDLAREKFDLYGSADKVADTLRSDVARGGFGSDAAREALDLVQSGRLRLHEPEGSRNYVVFDDSLIEILRKYGLAGAAPLAGLGATLSSGDQQ